MTHGGHLTLFNATLLCLFRARRNLFALRDGRPERSSNVGPPQAPSGRTCLPAGRPDVQTIARPL